MAGIPVSVKSSFDLHLELPSKTAGWGSEYDIHDVNLCAIVRVKRTEGGDSIAYELEK
jgi:hypothetical protein